jgi:serine protease AprX
MVFYKDKSGTLFTTVDPLPFLSQRAISRRNNQGIAITTEDLPVSAGYVNAVNGTGAKVVYSSRWFNASLVEATATQALDIQNLTDVQSVVYVAPGKTGTGGRVKSPSKFMEATEDFNAKQNQMLGLNDMLADGLTGEGVAIAVLDSGFPGVNTIQPFADLILENRILDSYNFAYKTSNVFLADGHGTQVLSTIAAKATGFTGGATDATFLLYVSEYVPTEFRVEEYLWAFAAERADSAGADIITSSLGYNEFDDASMDYTYDDLDGQTTAISKAASWAAEKGIVVIVSAGNKFPGSNWVRIAAPADAAQVLAVGSVQENYIRAPSSLIGPSADGRIKPDVMAMGVGAVVISSSGPLAAANGTSFSCPQIASLAAGIWQREPALTAAEIRMLVRQAGSQYFNPDNEKGYGIPTYRAVRNILDFPLTGSHVDVFPNPIIGNSLNVSVVPGDGTIVSVQVFDLLGQLMHREDFTSQWQPLALDFSQVQSGAYLIKIHHANSSKTFRIMKP